MKGKAARQALLIEPRHGRISKRGNSQVLSVLVEAAWIAVRSPGPLRAFGERIRASRGGQVAAIAVARKIATIAWHLLAKGEDYAFSSPSAVRAKIRGAELKAGAPRRRGVCSGPRITPTAAEREAEKQLAACAEAGHRCLTADWGRVDRRARRWAPARHRGAHLEVTHWGTSTAAGLNPWPRSLKEASADKAT